MGRNQVKPTEGGVPAASTQFEGLFPLIQRAARARLAAPVAMGIATRQDREDLEQEAMIAVWRALQYYDSSRASLRTFVERVVAARLASLVRARRSKAVFEPIEEHHLIGFDGIPAVEFRMDFHRACAVLDANEQCLAVLLTKFSPTEACRLMGTARSTVYERIRRIRVAFERAGYSPSADRGR